MSQVKVTLENTVTGYTQVVFSYNGGANNNLGISALIPSIFKDAGSFATVRAPMVERIVKPFAGTFATIPTLNGIW